VNARRQVEAAAAKGRYRRLLNTPEPTEADAAELEEVMALLHKSHAEVQEDVRRVAEAARLRQLVESEPAAREKFDQAHAAINDHVKRRDALLLELREEGGRLHVEVDQVQRALSDALTANNKLLALMGDNPDLFPPQVAIAAPRPAAPDGAVLDVGDTIVVPVACCERVDPPTEGLSEAIESLDQAEADRRMRRRRAGR
jgi:hypothetical protein